MPVTAPAPLTDSDDCSTLEVARRLGMAVRSVQLMVDRGELDAWKTPGGHRRISRASVDRWVAERQRGAAAPAGTAAAPPPAAARAAGQPRRVLLIEDSNHYQNLVRLLVQQRFPDVELHIAHDGIEGLAMVGRLQPDVLLVDILLPGIDGATLVTGLRSSAAFGSVRPIVVTSLEGEQLAPYAFALGGLPVVHKSRLVTDLPPLVAQALAEAQAAVRPAGAGPA
jgi:excisionase family DNA binding protein